MNIQQRITALLSPFGGEEKKDGMRVFSVLAMLVALLILVIARGRAPEPVLTLDGADTCTFVALVENGTPIAGVLRPTQVLHLDCGGISVATQNPVLIKKYRELQDGLSKTGALAHAKIPCCICAHGTSHTFCEEKTGSPSYQPLPYPSPKW